MPSAKAFLSTKPLAAHHQGFWLQKKQSGYFETVPKRDEVKLAISKEIFKL
jgi:hypothetical protein